MKTELFERIVSLLDLDEKQTYAILDFGCGDGTLLSRIFESVASNSRPFGTDASETSIEKARLANCGIDFRSLKFTEALDYADEAFDIVVSVDTLECIPNKSALLAETARIVRPGGRVLFAHWDWDTQVYCSEHQDIVRRLVASFSDWQQG
jgi:ubiquinone/menaquinone biosynthesis C-methylase UbiE